MSNLQFICRSYNIMFILKHRHPKAFDVDTWTRPIEFLCCGRRIMGWRQRQRSSMHNSERIAEAGIEPSVRSKCES